MARAMSMESLDKKIEKAEADVKEAKKKYDEATARLKDLLDKKDAIMSQQVINAISKSSKSYEEILRFIMDDDEDSYGSDSTWRISYEYR